MSALYTARFFTTVVDRRGLPAPGVPEVAFIGRSNAGKSSAINVLCNRRRLAFSSRTPGRTQALNFYAVGPNDAIDAFLVDMPGYGYAAAPGAVRHGWDALAGRYLRERAALTAAVMMVDIRRLFTELDRGMLKWLPAEVPLLVLLTKCDKLNRRERQAVLARTQELLGALATDEADIGVSLFSALSGEGVADAAVALRAWICP